jgi:hypothetical protein
MKDYQKAKVEDRVPKQIFIPREMHKALKHICADEEVDMGTKIIELIKKEVEEKA